MNRQQSPEWAPLIGDSQMWRLEGQTLFHNDYIDTSDSVKRRSSRLQNYLVWHFWAAQINSRVVQKAREKVCSDLGSDQWGLNIGAGHPRIHPRILNLDVFKGEHVDIVNVGTRLPFRNDCVGCIVSQEVLEHVSRPREYVEEAFRVLKPGGLFYCQLPFIIGYHPGPTDFWRFTKEGIRELFTMQPWEVVEIEPTLGHGSGFYRILVEFMAVNASIISPRLYKPIKGLCSLAFFPLQWLDALTPYSSEQHRIPGGYYCIARKPHTNLERESSVAQS